MSMKNFSPEVTPKKSNGLLDNVKGSGKEVNLYVHDCMPLYFSIYENIFPSFLGHTKNLLLL